MKIFNTLTQRKEVFKPCEGKTVRMYVCGPTVYDHAHIGHARSAVVFDTIRRWLEFKGYKVVYVRNYTDVDDKIIKRAKEEGKPWNEIAETFIKSYEEDMRALNVLEPTYKPRVTQHIEDIIKTIKGLIEKGFAYRSGGNVYYCVEKFPEYGKLSGRKPSDMLAGARVEPEEGKRNPLDFALWKASKEDEPGWNSPWGRGRPGWHIECSVMAMKYLGETIDIHGGGLDLIFPHHENEIAQSEAYTGKPFARYWVHNGFVMVNKEKMSKSLGNFFTVKEVLNHFSPDALRLFLLSTHYRSPIDFSFENLKDAERSLQRLKNFISSEEIFESLPEGGKGERVSWSELESAFEEAMDDDFNTARAIGVLFEIVKRANQIKDSAVRRNSISPEERATLKEAVHFVGRMLKVLGFKLEKEEKDSESELIEILIDVRQELRRRKLFDLADAIRERLSKLGIVLEDLPGKTIYRRL
jgi:cysteinyl-tRNA synthetase